MESLNGLNSKCFLLMSPLLESNHIDSFEAFVLGHAIGKNGTQRFKSILDTLEKLLTLKRAYRVPQKMLEPVFCLMLESNWSLVCCM